MRISFKCRCCLLLCMLLWGSALFVQADQILEAERFFAKPESVSGYVQVPGISEPMRYYAQNDELWANLTYEQKGSKQFRPFRDSGCNPSALAMAVMKLVDGDELSKIADYAQAPYSLCVCSINRAMCGRHNGRYFITSQRDFERFLPLIFADFACGNNTFGAYSRTNAQGTAMGYIPKVCQVYGLECRYTSDYQEALEAVGSDHQAVIALASGGGCFTNNGHYVFMAHADEEKLIVLDSLCREEYNTKNAGKLTILQPGLVTISHADIGYAKLSTYIIISRQVND